MAEENEDLVVELEPTALEPEIKVEPTPEPKVEAKPEIPPEEGIEALKAKLEEEKRGRELDAQRARDAEARVVKAQGEVQESQLVTLTNAIEFVKQQQDVLEGRYAEAASAGDWTAAAKVQREMTDRAAELNVLEQGKQSLSEKPKPTLNDPVERLASQLSPRSAQWVRAHPEFATDPQKFQSMIAAHNLAIGKGVQADSDAYFERVETYLDLRQPEHRVDPVLDDPTSGAAQPTQRRSSPPAEAPVTRQTTTNGVRPNVVRLTAAEREMAQMMGMSDTEYAKNKLALQKEGKMH